MADVNRFKLHFKINDMTTLSFADISKLKKIGGWCESHTMNLINFAITECMKNGEEYLEIGSYCGRSLVSALINNDRRAQVIEPFDLFLPDGDVIQYEWEETVDLFQMQDRVTLHKMDFMNFNKRLPPIGVFYYDGDHELGYTYHGLKKFEPYLADNAIIIVDDYNIHGEEPSVMHKIKYCLKFKEYGYAYSSKPVKADVHRWLAENKNAELIGITPHLNGQAVIIYNRNKLDD